MNEQITTWYPIDYNQSKLALLRHEKGSKMHKKEHHKEMSCKGMKEAKGMKHEKEHKHEHKKETMPKGKKK